LAHMLRNDVHLDYDKPMRVSPHDVDTCFS
jgi:hypothetical protein